MKGRCQLYQRGAMNSLRAVSFFGPKHFSTISRFLEFALVKGRCQRYQRGALDSMLAFSFFVPNFFYISISGGRTGEKEMSTVPTRCPEEYASIFVFRSKKFFLQYLLIFWKSQR